MKDSREFLERLREDGGRLSLPESLKPEWIEENLKESSSTGSGRRGSKRTGKDARRPRFIRFRPAMAAAACLLLMSAGLLGLYRTGILTPDGGFATPDGGPGASEQPVVVTQEGEHETDQDDGYVDTLAYEIRSYEEIYRLLRIEGIQDLQEEHAASGGAVREEAVAEEAAVSNQSSADSADQQFGETNVQTEGVDEADTIKNDGRYLYQLVRRTDSEGASYQGVQIADTQGGLRETAFVGRFQYPREILVWEDLLIVLEDGYYSANHLREAMEDVSYSENQYTKIHLYDISDREHPGLMKTYTVGGSYTSSRLADGYFYGFAFYWPSQGTGEEDYEAYIPRIEQELLPAEQIVCMDGEEADEFLVMVSIDLRNPEELLDSRAVLADRGILYVSADSIYLASWHSVHELEELPRSVPDAGGEGAGVETVRDSTQILRFSYQKGRFTARAEGRVPGRICDSFCLEQKGDYLRAASTVTEYLRRIVTDDRTGEVLGYEYLTQENDGLTNGLYVLDENLEVCGQAEGLAPGERIYSARYLGDTAYFVTYRQVDPLFAVDVSDPENPEVLSELKVTGFSEYLHVYGDGLLVGLGIETDEETGEWEGLKLSMFDLTDPTSLQEQTRIVLSEYHYSPSLYDYRSLLIDTAKNLIGFAASGTTGGSFRQSYLLYTYEDGSFVQKMEIVTEQGDRLRGTYIGDRFYLLDETGAIREYSLESGELTGELP